MKKTRKYGECLILVLLAIFAVACILTVSSGASLGLRNERITPQQYSDYLSYGLIATLLIRICIVLRTPFKGESRTTQTKSAVGIVLCVMLCGVGFVLGMRYIGFYITTALTLFILFMVFERWNKEKILTGLLFSLGICVVFFIAFRYLKVFLPNAWLF